jgi:hypothetical protein
MTERDERIRMLSLTLSRFSAFCAKSLELQSNQRVTRLLVRKQEENGDGRNNEGSHCSPVQQAAREQVVIHDPGPGEVLVNVRTSGVCRTDLHAASGDWPVFAAAIFSFVGCFGESAIPIIMGGVGDQMMGNFCAQHSYARGYTRRNAHI